MRSEFKFCVEEKCVVIYYICYSIDELGKKVLLEDARDKVVIVFNENEDKEITITKVKYICDALNENLTKNEIVINKLNNLLRVFSIENKEIVEGLVKSTIQSLKNILLGNYTKIPNEWNSTFMDFYRDL